MLNYLEIKNGIRYKNTTFVFKEGLTCVHGKNGAGKSLIQEFIRFALFGASALRGSVRDYPVDMWIKLGFTVKEEKYEVARGLKNAILTLPDGEKIEGLKPVSEKITRILGYGLPVFDMGNCAKQKELTSLGRMKPAERKTAIDEVIGMDAVAELLKEIRAERKEKQSWLDGYKVGVVAPEEVIRPENYRPYLELLQELTAEREKNREYEAQSAVCDSLECDEPKWIGEIPVGNLGDENLHKNLKREFDILRLQDHTPRFASMKELLDLRRRSSEWEDYLEPEISIAEIEQGKKDWSAYNNWIRAQKAKCPNCGTEFAVNGATPCIHPEKSEIYYTEQWRRLITRPKSEKPANMISLAEFNHETELLKKNERYEELKDKLKNFVEVDYDRLRNYKLYEAACQKYERYVSAMEKLSRTPRADREKITRLEAQCAEAMLYEDRIKRYNELKQVYDEKVGKITEVENDIRSFDKEIEGLETFLRSVKSMITPSISRLSTKLAQKMSKGEINNIEINDNFDILCNGRELKTFSGSEEAVANLAIRLALGKVLTYKVFNVFIGDELDADMDDERAEIVNECLQKLRGEIEQIIVISHHSISGDNEIIVGD